jgi:hypothetical protein
LGSECLAGSFAGPKKKVRSLEPLEQASSLSRPDSLGIPVPGLPDASSAGTQDQTARWKQYQSALLQWKLSKAPPSLSGAFSSGSGSPSASDAQMEEAGEPAPGTRAALQSLKVKALFAEARALLGQAPRPRQNRRALQVDLPVEAEALQWNAEETLEVSLEQGAWMQETPAAVRLTLSPLTAVYDYRMPVFRPLVVCLDASLSMTGPKRHWAALALAVLLLQFAEEPCVLITFETEAQVLSFPWGSQPRDSAALEQVMERFLASPAQGYTHLEKGLLLARREQEALRARWGKSHPVGMLLITDGQYTAGRDPRYLAPSFPGLQVLHLGEEGGAGLKLCQDLAHRCEGALLEVRRMEDLPFALLDVLKVHRSTRVRVA